MQYISETQTSFQHYKLIVGLPSLGNVGQLGADILISTLGAKRVGYIHSKCILPLIGNDPHVIDTSGVLHVAAEVFVDEKNKVAILQIRSPVCRKKEFTKSFFEWVAKEQFDNVWILYSSNAAYAYDELLNIEPPILLSSFANTENPFEKISSVVKKEDEQVFIQGVGKDLLDQARNTKIPYAMLLLLCNEGDNLPDGIAIASAILSCLNLKMKMKVPSSFIQLYGPPFNRSLYT